MKKFLAAVLAAIFILAVFTGCQTGEKSGNSGGTEKSNLPVLKVLIDLSLGGADTSAQCSELENFLENHAVGCGTDYLVEVEALPTIDDPEKRNPAISGMHMELLDGGPDVFLLRSFSDPLGQYSDLKNFFPYPASAIRQNIFLPLDEYIEEDEDWKHLLPSVVEAGTFDGSQYLVPLSYTIRASLVEQSKYELTEKLPMTSQQMLTSDDPVLRWSAQDGAAMLGTLADYKEEKLTFTEEELLSLVREINRAKESTADLDFIQLGAVPNLSIIPANDQFFLEHEGTDYHMIPSYNKDGGVTTQVDRYAAINQNTQYPQEAYAILKAFFGPEGQKDSSVIGLNWPVYMGLGRQDTPICDGWYLSDANYQQLEALQEQISQVEFVTPLSAELETLFRKSASAEDETQLEEMVRDSYARMSAMLSES